MFVYCIIVVVCVCGACVSTVIVYTWMPSLASFAWTCCVSLHVYDCHDCRICACLHSLHMSCMYSRLYLLVLLAVADTIPGVISTNVAYAFHPHTRNFSRKICCCVFCLFVCLLLTVMHILLLVLLVLRGDSNDGNKIYLAGLPPELSDGEVRAFASAIGPLKAFSNVRDLQTNQPKGYAFFSYVDSALTDVAIAAFNGVTVAGKTLSCTRAIKNAASFQDPSAIAAQLAGILPGFGTNPSALSSLLPGFAVAGLPQQTNPAALLSSILPGLPGAGFPSAASAVTPAAVAFPLLSTGISPTPTQFLTLSNMTTRQELLTEYNDIVEDVREECDKFGKLVDVFGRGEILILSYDAVGGAVTAVNALSGRKFSGKTIVTNYISRQ